MNKMGQLDVPCVLVHGSLAGIVLNFFEANNCEVSDKPGDS